MSGSIASWVALRTLLGPSWASLGEALGFSWAPLGRSCCSLGRSWAAVGPFLGRSWALLGRSWADLGPLMVHPGRPCAISRPFVLSSNACALIFSRFLDSFRMIFLLEMRSCNHPLSISLCCAAGCAQHMESARPSDQEGEGVPNHSSLTRPAARKPSLPASAVPAKVD